MAIVSCTWYVTTISGRVFMGRKEWVKHY